MNMMFDKLLPRMKANGVITILPASSNSMIARYFFSFSPNCDLMNFKLSHKGSIYGPILSLASPGKNPMSLFDKGTIGRAKIT